LKRINEKSTLVRIREGWGAFCLLGVIMLNYPFIHIFNKPHEVGFGFPLMVLYLFIGWPISIFVIYLFSRHLVNPDANNRPDEEADEEID
jgi:hypothetical protein